ncbi:hypothetical protein H0H93_011233 [Arthromyces matolae]|nr:hypothetical protein H0H93_011233 [Arthromyces matolae]
MDRAEMMLRHLTNLEACRIVDLDPFDPLKDEYDGKDAKVHHYRIRHMGRSQKDDWDYSRLSGWFDAEIVAEFKEIKENACWPCFTGSTPYTFPRLHTLCLDVLDLQRITSFAFPSLRHLDITCEEYTDNLEPIRHIFPATLTHFVFCGGEVSIAQITASFPCLRHLTLNIEYGRYPSSTYDVRHFKLEVIELAAYRNCYRQSLVEDIVRGVRDGKLPALREIRVSRPSESQMTNYGLPFEEFDALGVALRVCVRKPMNFGIMMKRHYV